jgi:hypothetical protein
MGAHHTMTEIYQYSLIFGGKTSLVVTHMLGWTDRLVIQYSLTFILPRLIASESQN